MNGWKFAFSRRWLGYLALATVFAIVCCLLGVWQLNRRAEAWQEIDRIDNNYTSKSVPIDDVLGSLESFDPSQKWTPVIVTGVYLHSEQLLVRNRPYNGNPGFVVLTPLLRADGTVFIVDRGWVPPGSAQDTPDFVPDAPSGTVTVEARLKAAEPNLPGRSAPPGQIATVELPRVAELLDRPTFTGAYGLLVSEIPPAESRPLAAAKPTRDEGPHLSYALQWFVFAIFGYLGFAYALRQEYRLVNADDPDEQLRARAREVKRAARKPTDNDVEDSIIDAGS
ncbi:MAG: SURF1 family protein [Microbacteriaceae bacterium]